MADASTLAEQLSLSCYGTALLNTYQDSLILNVIPLFHRILLSSKLG